MKPKLAMSVGALAVLALIGVTIAEMQLGGEAQPAEASADSTPQSSDASDSNEQAGGAEANADSQTDRAGPPSPRDTDVRRARGLYMRPDGTLVGRVNYIDRSTLTLMPVPNALVSFIQERKVAGQAVTDTRGMFAVKGLTPWAVYSVITASKDHVCTFATVARPYDHDDDRGRQGEQTSKAVGLNPGWVNEIRFVALLADDDADASDNEASEDGENEDGENEDGEEPATPDEDGTPADYQDYEFHEFQMIPREDFIMALREGLYGFDVSGLPPPSPTGGAGAGGVGGGGAGDVVGPAVIGTAIGAGIGAAIGASQTDNDRASPFRP